MLELRVSKREEFQDHSKASTVHWQHVSCPKAWHQLMESLSLTKEMRIATWGLGWTVSLFCIHRFSLFASVLNLFLLQVVGISYRDKWLKYVAWHPLSWISRWDDHIWVNSDDPSQKYRSVSRFGLAWLLLPLSVTPVRPWGGVLLRSPDSGLHIPVCCQVSKIGRPPETQHYPRQFLPPSVHPPPTPPPDSSPLPAPCFPLDTLHSCCHSALSQSQFIPSSWPFRDMHSPGRRGRAATAGPCFQGPLLQGPCRCLSVASKCTTQASEACVEYLLQSTQEH